MDKIDDAKQGKNLSGAETMCRCIDTLVKLARLEMDYARLRRESPALPYLVGGEAELSPTEKSYREFRKTIPDAKKGDEEQ
jgi:hypothetical protein